MRLIKKISLMLSVIIIVNSFSLSVFAFENNLALNKKVTVTSTYENYEATNATDGDYDSSWYADPNKDTASISVDLGAVISINRIKIYWGKYDYTNNFKIEVSDSVSPGDEDWTELESVSTSSSSTRAHYITESVFDMTEQRHVRIVCNEKVDWSYEIFEFEVYCDSDNTSKIPTNLKASNVTSNSVELSWDSIENTDAKYRLYRQIKNDADSKELIYSGTDCKYVDSSVLQGKTYMYTVLSVVNDIQSKELKAISVTISPHTGDELNLATAVVSKTYVKLSWENYSTAKSYSIYRDNKKIASVNDNKYTDYGLFENTNYVYTVKAMNFGTVIKEDTVSVITMSASVESVWTKEITDSSISLSFDVPECKEIRITKNGENIKNFVISEKNIGKTFSFKDDGLKNNTEYIYSFVTVNECNAISEYTTTFACNTSDSSKLGNVLNASISNRSADSITLKWNCVENADSYEIFKLIDGEMKSVYTSSELKYVDNDVLSGKEYSYYIKAENNFENICSQILNAKAEYVNDNNIAYLPQEWFAESTYEDFDKEAFVKKQIKKLSDAKIKYAFCDLGKWECLDNVITEDIDYSALAAWMAEAKKNNINIVACFNCASDESISTSVKVDITNKLLTYCKNLYLNGEGYESDNYKIYGVQLDFEPYTTSSQRDLLLYASQELRKTLGNDFFISVATPSKNGRYSKDEMTSLINCVDMINPMIYDSNEPYYEGDTTTEEEINMGITRNKSEYINLVKNTCIWFDDIISDSKNTDCILCPTLPVYEDKKGANRPDGGFPDKDDSLNLYHCNYNYILEESLETLENALIGIQQAKDSGANIQSCGIFYWPYIIGDSPTIYSLNKSSYYNPQKDYNDWFEMWVTKS